jgi:PAS domain-containing protein
MGDALEVSQNALPVAPKDRRFLGMLLENAFYAGGPLIVLIQVKELGSDWRRISFFLLGASILCFAARLALGEFRETESDRRLRAVHGALAQSEARFRTLIEDAPLAVVISRDAKTLWVNHKFLELFGFTDATELVGGPIGNLLSPECRAQVELRAHLRTHGQPIPVHYECGIEEGRDPVRSAARYSRGFAAGRIWHSCVRVGHQRTQGSGNCSARK